MGNGMAVARSEGRLQQYVADDFAVDVGEPVVAALEAERQAFVVDA